MKKYILLMFTVVALNSCTSQNKKAAQQINIEQIKSEVIGKDVQFVDVRTANEYNAGHIDDAINIDFLDGTNFAEQFSKLDKSKPLYIYCQVGGRSAKATKQLTEMGFETVYDYSGGYGEWSRKQ